LLTEVLDSPSVLLTDMAGSLLPTVIAHGEGRAAFRAADGAEHLAQTRQIPLRYVNHQGRVADRYPANPNGSAAGIAGVCSEDGRVTILMPHPERAFRASQLSWMPPSCRGIEAGPWLRLFQNARCWLG